MRTDYLVKSFLLINLLFSGHLIGMGEKPKRTLHEVCLSGCEREVDWYIESGCDLNEPDAHGFTPLHYAAAGGRRYEIDKDKVHNGVEGMKDSSISILKKLVGLGLPLNIPDAHGRTPIFYAGSSGNIKKKLEILRKAGADPASS